MTGVMRETSTLVSQSGSGVTPRSPLLSVPEGVDMEEFSPVTRPVVHRGRGTGKARGPNGFELSEENPDRVPTPLVTGVPLRTLGRDVLPCVPSTVARPHCSTTKSVPGHRTSPTPRRRGRRETHLVGPQGRSRFVSHTPMGDGLEVSLSWRRTVGVSSP